jgi:hypothetical protein
MLFMIDDRTRDETYVTDNEPNALRFLRDYRKKHAGHVVDLWTRRDGEGWKWVEV